VHSHQGLLGDDTGLNAVRLICDTGTDTVMSSEGPFGVWKPPLMCPQGEHLVSFRLRVEAAQGPWDDTAANNVDMSCSEGTLLQGQGNDRGTWGDWSPACPSSCGVCGISTRVDPFDDNIDDTGLND
ncbi:VMO1 protein, partial [Dryoscopus gambensis]|nr:VMO1 protein [Dryoscopus gambensis]